MSDLDNTVERLPFINDEDPKLLLIKGNLQKQASKGYVKKVANAISKVIEKHGSALLRCIGAAAVNNAVKSVIIASSHDEDLFIVPSFHNVNFKELGEKVSIVLEVRKFDDEDDQVVEEDVEEDVEKD